MLALHATATGKPMPKYQWLLNGQLIPGADGPMYIKAGFSAADIGTYTCVVQNLAGSALWEEALVALEQ